jgi:hypothetical protein
VFVNSLLAISFHRIYIAWDRSRKLYILGTRRTFLATLEEYPGHLVLSVVTLLLVLEGGDRPRISRTARMKTELMRVKGMQESTFSRFPHDVAFVIEVFQYTDGSSIEKLLDVKVCCSFIQCGIARTSVLA